MTHYVGPVMLFFLLGFVFHVVTWLGALILEAHTIRGRTEFERKVYEFGVMWGFSGSLLCALVAATAYALNA